MRPRFLVCRIRLSTISLLPNSGACWKPSVIWQMWRSSIGYRFLQMLADTKPVIAPIDQDAWARNLNYLDSPPSELVAFYGLGRHHNLRLLRNLKVSVCLSPGNATGGDRCRPGGKDGGTRCCALASDREIESSSEQRVGSAAPYSAPAAGMVVEITLIDSEPWWQ